MTTQVVRMKSARWSLFSVCGAGMGVMDLGTETGKDGRLENPENMPGCGRRDRLQRWKF